MSYHSKLRWQDQGDWKVLLVYLLLIDFGLLFYWLIAMNEFFPAEWLFKSYDDPIVSAWNWSFLPLDLLASFMGLIGIWTIQRQRQRLGERLILIGLTLCFCAGLMALSFWALMGDFDWFWWGANGLLTLPSSVFLARRLGCVRL